MGFFSDLFGGKKTEEPKPAVDPVAAKIESVRNGGTESLTPYELLCAEFPLEDQVRDLPETSACYYRDYYEEAQAGELGQITKEYTKETLEKDRDAFRERLSMIAKSCAFAGYYGELYDKVASFVGKMDVLSSSAKSDEEVDALEWLFGIYGVSDTL